MNGLTNLSDDDLLKVYQTALLLCLEVAFITIIQLELERRGLAAATNK